MEMLRWPQINRWARKVQNACVGVCACACVRDTERDSETHRRWEAERDGSRQKVPSIRLVKLKGSYAFSFRIFRKLQKAKRKAKRKKSKLWRLSRKKRCRLFEHFWLQVQKMMSRVNNSQISGLHAPWDKERAEDVDLYGKGDFFGAILQMTVSCCCIKLINSLAAHQYVYRYVSVRPGVVVAQPL